MMKSKILVLFICLFYTSLCYATVSNNWLVNSDSNVNELYVKKGMLTTLHFSSNIEYFLIGNIDIADVIKVNNNTLAISTILGYKSTNLNVKTKNGTYIFLLRTLVYQDLKEPNLHVNIESTDYKETSKNEYQYRNPALDYSFTMRGYKDYRRIAPNRIWTDGKRTYLDYNGTKFSIDRTLPIVSEVVDNIDTKVTMDVKKNIIVVHALAKKLTVFSNGAFVCIEYTGKKYETY